MCTSDIGKDPGEPPRVDSASTGSELQRQLWKLVDQFDAHSERERLSRERFLSELSALENPFLHDGQLVHVTGSGLVLGPRGTVLHVHRKLGVWLQPGGHVDIGETVAEAARRETVEETGLPVRHPRSGPRLVHIDVHPGPSSHLHLDLRYLLLSPDVEPAPAEGESQQVRWWSLEDAVEVADEGLVDGLGRLAVIARSGPVE